MLDFDEISGKFQIFVIVQYFFETWLNNEIFSYELTAKFYQWKRPGKLKELDMNESAFER